MVGWCDFSDESRAVLRTLWSSCVLASHDFFRRTGVWAAGAGDSFRGGIAQNLRRSRLSREVRSAQEGRIVRGILLG